MLFLMRFVKGVDCFFFFFFASNFAYHFPDCVLVEEFSWFTKFCQLVLFAYLIVLLALALSCLNNLRLQVSGSF